jgi:hypothetical protein
VLHFFINAHYLSWAGVRSVGKSETAKIRPTAGTPNGQADDGLSRVLPFGNEKGKSGVGLNESEIETLQRNEK